MDTPWLSNVVDDEVVTEKAERRQHTMHQELSRIAGGLVGFEAKKSISATMSNAERHDSTRARRLWRASVETLYLSFSKFFWIGFFFQAGYEVAAHPSRAGAVPTRADEAVSTFALLGGAGAATGVMLGGCFMHFLKVELVRCSTAVRRRRWAREWGDRDLDLPVSAVLALHTWLACATFAAFAAWTPLLLAFQRTASPTTTKRPGFAETALSVGLCTGTVFFLAAQLGRVLFSWRRRRTRARHRRAVQTRRGQNNSARLLTEAPQRNSTTLAAELAVCQLPAWQTQVLRISARSLCEDAVLAGVSVVSAAFFLVATDPNGNGYDNGLADLFGAHSTVLGDGYGGTRMAVSGLALACGFASVRLLVQHPVEVFWDEDSPAGSRSAAGSRERLESNDSLCVRCSAPAPADPPSIQLLLQRAHPPLPCPGASLP